MSGGLATSPGMMSTTTAAARAPLPHIADPEIPQVLADPGVTLIDFTATWCGPCKQLKPLLQDLAHHYRGRVKVVTLDVEESPLATQAFKVVSMPTMVLVRDGREVGRMIGLRTARHVAGAIDRALAGDVAITGP
jgi:thioredoxin 1